MSTSPVVILGANGFLGLPLALAFREAGHEVITVSRHRQEILSDSVHEVWDGRTQGSWSACLDGAALVLNLAGRSINCRHTPKNLAAILSSRVDSTLAVRRAVDACASPPQVWMNASTAAIYRPRWGEEPAAVEEDASAPGEPLRDVAIAWEEAFFHGEMPRTRRLALRISVVLGAGGALPLLQRITRLGLGGRAGSGRQWMSWITVDDLCAAVLHAFQHAELDGPLNLAAPEAVSNRDFMAAMRRNLRCPMGIPAPTWGLQLGARLAGTEAKLVLESMKVAPARLQASGFRFATPRLEQALESLLPLS